jgi:GNAT superfamily N-acetyltransferase
MPTTATTAHVDTQWAATLGCGIEDLRRSGVQVAPHGTLAGYRGAMLLRRGNSCIVSVPLALVAAVRQHTAGRTADEVFTASFLTDLFGTAVERLVGPAWQGYADRSDFLAHPTRGTRRLASEDEWALHQLEMACDRTEWEHSTIVWGQPPVFGCFVGKEVVAAGTLRPWGAGILSVGIITHPVHRGKGYARAVVSTMSAYGLAQGAVLRYQTRRANAPAVAIAQTLSYQEYGLTLAVRLARLDGE